MDTYKELHLRMDFGILKEHEWVGFIPALCISGEKLEGMIRDEKRFSARHHPTLG